LGLIPNINLIFLLFIIEYFLNLVKNKNLKK
jgi:hypothetical protein